MGINIENYFIKSVTFIKCIPVDKTGYHLKAERREIEFICVLVFKIDVQEEN